MLAISWRDKRLSCRLTFFKGVQVALQKELMQDILNELFHLLKKYDLAEEAIRQKQWSIPGIATRAFVLRNRHAAHDNE